MLNISQCQEKRLSQKSNLRLLKYSENSRMKAFVFIAHILIIVTLIYGADIEQLHKFYSMAAICTDQLHLPRNAPNPQIVECLLDQYHLVDENGILKMYEAAQNLNYLISDPSTLMQAQQRLKFCFHYGAAGEYSYERKMRLSGCLLPLVELVDKPII